MTDLRQQFIGFSVEAEVLKFGQFTTKAGRLSPYFFNAGLFHDGATLGKLAQFYAQTLLDSGVEFDMLFGPAYKGITLASATAVALAAKGRDTSYAYNRKEAKDHGEGGTIVGAKLQGKVVIIDDVISAGTSVRESVTMIRARSPADETPRIFRPAWAVGCTFVAPPTRPTGIGISRVPASEPSAVTSQVLRLV